MNDKRPSPPLGLAPSQGKFSSGRQKCILVNLKTLSRPLRWLAALTAAALLAGCALAEPAVEPSQELTSEQVQAMEARLAELGYLSAEPDGEMDGETRSALESFQQANGLDVTGEADAATLERLNHTDALSRQDYLARFANAYAQMDPLEQGSVSNDVLVMQRRLKEYGYYSGECDGVFNDATRLAVESFQMVNGLQVTGIADGMTLMRLMADSPITWPAWLSEMSASEGDTGLNVYVLQRRLTQLGYYTGSCSSNYGELTRQAVEAFQQASGMETTGIADAATWAALYTGAAAAVRPEGVLSRGDSGDNIREMQERLNALGFFDHNITGEFGYTTETAVRLFQMASGMTATGEADTQTQSLLMSEAAASTLDSAVQQRFELILDAAGEDTQAAVADIAAGLLGASFGTADDELYPGYSFVQYVCVAAGLPITFPEDLIRMADRQAESIEAVNAGDIVAFQSASADNVTITLAIGAGDGRLIGTTESGGWVVLSYMDRMENATIYCWDAT